MMLKPSLYVRFMAAPGDLTDSETLAVLLGVCRVRGARRIAAALVARFGCLGAVLAADPARCREVPGVSEPVSLLLKVVRECGIRTARGVMTAGPVLVGGQAIADYCRVALAHEPVERVHAVFLDATRRPITAEELARGSVTAVNLTPRDIIRRALELHASGLILVHNHPSGNLTPSFLDVDTTRALRRAADLLDITLWDHLVVGKTGYLSLRDAGLL